jgi:hypothetical protein
MNEKNMLPDRIIYRLIVVPDNDTGRLFLKKFVSTYIENDFLNFRIDIQNEMIYICYEIEKDFLSNKSIASLSILFDIKNLLIYSVSLDDIKLRLIEILAKDNAIYGENYVDHTKDVPCILNYAWQTKLTDKFVELYQEQF